MLPPRSLTIAQSSPARTRLISLDGGSRSCVMPPGGGLRRALEHNELRLHYQPMYSMTSGAVVAVDALLRWQHPTRGLLPPAEFLAVAEGPPLVAPIGVLKTAITQAAV